MKLFGLTLLLFVSSLKQMKAQTIADPANLSHRRFDSDCVYRQKYAVAQRSKFYPFSIAGTIKLASFRYHKNNYPLSGDAVLYDSLIEVRALTKSEINELTDILYNNFRYKPPKPLYYKGKKYYISGSNQCFFPRNAILFFDNAGHLKASVLLCFHCDNHRSSSEKISFGDGCTGKTEKLRQFFIKMKVIFGTDLNKLEYPGEE